MPCEISSSYPELVVVFISVRKETYYILLIFSTVELMLKVVHKVYCETCDMLRFQLSTGPVCVIDEVLENVRTDCVLLNPASVELFSGALEMKKMSHL